MAHFSVRIFLIISLVTGGILPLFGQSIPSKGSDHTLEVATWNLKFFGDPNAEPDNDERALDNVEAIIRASHIDVWALQEIREPSYFYRLLDSLGSDYDGQLGPDTYLRLGFIYRTEVLQQVQPIQQILQTQSSDFGGRPPLRLDARVVLPDTSFDVTLINVHMKARSDAASYEKRKRAAQALKTYIDVFLASRAVILLGDFNDELEQSIYAGNPSPYQAFVADSLPSPDPQYYFFPSLYLERAGAWSLCGWQSLIDHIGVSDELVPLYEKNSAGVFRELFTAIPGYCSLVSDHIPVYARFKRASATDAPRVRLASLRWRVYPNPFHDHLMIDIEGVAEPTVRLELFDLLGRNVAVRTVRIAASGRIRWEVGRTLAPGVYFLRISMGTHSIITKVVRQ